MKSKKRLFLFAGYDQNGIIDDALIYYLASVSKLGDVVLYMDCDCKQSELNKIKKYCIFADAARHGEYDFGSYKRAYQYAHDHDILKNYDYLYLVNDSVFGPMMNIISTIRTIEALPTDAAGLVVSKHKTHSFMESWFVRLNKKVFLSEWFDSFMTSITHQEQKTTVTIKYEHGLSNLVVNNGCTWSGVYTINGRYTYNQPKKLFNRGCPFIKKASFIRHNGAIGRQIKYIFDHCDKDAHDAIMNTAMRLYGGQHMRFLLTSNPIKILLRNIKYATHKIKDGNI